MSSFDLRQREEQGLDIVDRRSRDAMKVYHKARQGGKYLNLVSDRFGFLKRSRTSGRYNVSRYLRLMNPSHDSASRRAGPLGPISAHRGIGEKIAYAIFQGHIAPMDLDGSAMGHE